MGKHHGSGHGKYSSIEPSTLKLEGNGALKAIDCMKKTGILPDSTVAGENSKVFVGEEGDVSVVPNDTRRDPSNDVRNTITTNEVIGLDGSYFSPPQDPRITGEPFPPTRVPAEARTPEMTVNGPAAEVIHGKALGCVLKASGLAP